MPLDPADKFVRRMLDVSTTHLSLEAVDWLEEHAKGDEHGYCIAVRDEGEEDIPASLNAVFALARECECLWVMFDSDADSHPRLAHWYEDGHRTEEQGPVTEAAASAAPRKFNVVGQIMLCIGLDRIVEAASAEEAERLVIAEEESRLYDEDMSVSEVCINSSGPVED